MPVFAGKENKISCSVESSNYELLRVGEPLVMEELECKFVTQG
jgi:hypothetical protein